MTTALPVEEAVRERYAVAANERVSALCCPVQYDPRWLEVIPQAVLDRDYGCGDPSKWLLPGDTVLDLGSGGGKICFIAAQVVGPTGRVIGVDFNPPMLELAQSAQRTVAERLGYDNVRFVKGRIQDLQLDLEQWETWLAQAPVSDAAGWSRAEAEAARLRATAPLIPANSIDVVVSNCVLNLVGNAERTALFQEIFRVLKPGGRAVISDIVADRDVPLALQNDPELWSGCISGAFREDRFPEAFREAGFRPIELLERQVEPWTVVQGIEFRSLTVRAWKPLPATGHQQRVIYRGPWHSVTDDDGVTLTRGVVSTVKAAAAQRWMTASATRDDLWCLDAAAPGAVGSCCTVPAGLTILGGCGPQPGGGPCC
jgi:arsenite methyltransferase